MKKPILLMMSICALTFFGCSAESSESLDSQAQTQVNEDQQSETPTTQTADFKLVGVGEFKKADLKLCDSKGEFLNKGESTTAEFGKLTAQFSFCTDFEGYNYLAGSYTTTEGDQFWFTSDQSGSYENGIWHQLIIDGGTGMFENASGNITIWRTERFNALKEEGTFTDYGKGLINY